MNLARNSMSKASAMILGKTILFHIVFVLLFPTIHVFKLPFPLIIAVTDKISPYKNIPEVSDQ